MGAGSIRTTPRLLRSASATFALWIAPEEDMRRRIISFHTDAEGHWVAELECGHAQRVSHEPPWQERPWVLTEEGRAAMVGTNLDCWRCGGKA